MVRRQYDAKGFAARPRIGTPGRCPIAYHLPRQRIHDHRPRDGLGKAGFRYNFPSSGTYVRSRTMTTATETPNAQSTTAQKWLHAYRRMMAIRLFEESVNDLYTRAIMPG